jgi:hypothetical protein
MPLDVAEWSYMWVNVKRAETARGAFVGGQQMYVEYMIRPKSVIRSRSCWCTAVGDRALTGWEPPTVVRAGSSISCGRLQSLRRRSSGTWTIAAASRAARRVPAQAAVLENIAGRFTPPSANPAQTPNEYQKHHMQWPGAGNVGSPDLDQLVAGQGGSYVQQAPAGGAGRQGGAPGAAPGPGPGRGGTPVAANTVQPAPAPNVQHAAWRQAGADLLDKIGPAIIMTHSAGGPFGLLVAEARPALVKATVIIEGAGSGFGGGNRWGMSSIPVTYDPPITNPTEIKTHWVANPEPGVAGYFLQADPAHRLPNLKNTKVLFVTADSSFASPGNPGGVAFLKQAGVQAEELRLGSIGIKGNGHMMMVEKNSRQVLQPIIDWMTKNVTGSNNQSPAPRRGSGDSLALKLADTGIFWVGTGNKKKDALRHDSRRADVRAVLRAGGAAASAAGGPRPWRRRADDPLHGARRNVGMGAPLPPGRLQGVPRRSTGSRTLALSPPMRLARSVRSSPTTCSHVTPSRRHAHRTSSGRARAATSAIRSSISWSRRPTRRRATRSLRSRCGR